VNLYRFSVDQGFFDLYEIELLSGRILSRDVGPDLIDSGSIDMATVVINESAVQSLTLNSIDEAVGQIFYSNEEGMPFQAFQVAGVVRDANLLGLANDIKSSVFRLEPASFSNL